MKKRGQNLPIVTIILIVLGIAVLIVLIFGFSTGWGNFWNKIIAYGGGSANVDTIKQACILACNSQQKNKFCFEENKVKSGGQTFYATCNHLANGKELDATKTNCINYYGAKWKDSPGNGEVEVANIKDKGTQGNKKCFVNTDKKAATDAEIQKIKIQIDSCPGLC